MPSVMTITKSVVAHFSDSGDVEFQIQETELPQVGPNWVIIQVRACALIAAEDEKAQRGLLNSPISSASGDSLVHIGQEIAGVVKAVGEEVCSLQIGDRVVGIVPLDYNQSGCSNYVMLQEFDVVPIPDGVSYSESAATIGDAVKVYTALHYLGKLNTGDTVLVIGGAISLMSIFVQLTHHWSARTIAAVTSLEAKARINGLNLSSVLVIDASEPKGLKSRVMLETGDLGADIIVSQLSCHQENIPSLHEIISCLSVGGRLITSNPQTQLDPPQSRQLLLRCASVGYLFEQAWTLSSAQQGRYQHILMDIMEKVATKTLKPLIHTTITKLEEVCTTLKDLQPNSVKVNESWMLYEDCSRC
ncbi:quinone oxidoreductase-like protein 1 [Neocloeon triangulifer]|uniref:quinone oxidoreductase-like protein 1 n=1 Tax=Neocloeon triangulifer TaxID=2078957 RepID=UPI00286F09C1|nr:quinone oxidoreductase-like protein 1 [Neocloeon triangulifer]